MGGKLSSLINDRLKTINVLLKIITADSMKIQFVFTFQTPFNILGTVMLLEVRQPKFLK